MPAWWKGKLKSKSKSTASPRTKDPETPGTPRAAATVLPDEELVAVARHGTKEKANSFDEVLGSRKSGDLSPVGGGGGLGAGTGFVFGHPLPLPTSISSYGVSTGSASSISSSSSSEETPDLGLYRYLVFLFPFFSCGLDLSEAGSDCACSTRCKEAGNFLWISFDFGFLALFV